MAANFPRGGKHSLEEIKQNQSEDLFKTAESVTAAAKSKTKTSKKRKKDEGRKKKTAYVESLKFETLTEGLLVLGRVKEVQDFKVMVSLPNGLLATLPITAVSDTYTQRLQSVADSSSDDIDEVPTLKDIFRVGDGIPCRIVSAESKGTKRFVEVSAKPSDVNRTLPLQALKAGCLLYGAVQSVEEHGCRMDIGVPGIQAFLTNTASHTEDTELCEGRGLWCTLITEGDLQVMTGETRVVTLTAHNVRETMVTPSVVSTLECLQPGMKVEATVSQVLNNGLFVKCTKYKGCVYKTHVPQGLNQYSIGQKVEGRILYIHPNTKVISLSLLPGLLSCVQPDTVPFAGLAIGDFVDDAKVMFVDKSNGVFFRLHGCSALAPLHHLSDGKIKDLSQAFPQGSKHRCRVLGFQPADDVVLVSLKESVMNQKILSIRDIQPGQIVEGTVQAVHTSGVIVSLGKGLTGLISKMHVADVPLKNFEKKFAKGDKVKCLVLKVDVPLKKMYLSRKKSLLSTSRVIPTSLTGLEPGMQLEGFIIAVKENGVAVAFCNNVKGWVPRSQLSTVEITHPESTFYKGQVVRCRVLSCYPDQQKLHLSLVISGKAAIASKTEKMEDFEVGKLLDAKVTKKLEKNFEVELQPSGAKALLPREHLADSWDNQLLLWRSLEPGDSIDRVMLLKQTNVAIVTLKESFLSAAREGVIPKSIEELEPGQLVPGVIRNHQSYGIFVELPGGLRGLAPHKLTMDRPLPDLTRVFAYGQSVVVKVIEVKEDKGRFLCSLRMCDCYHDDPKVSLEMLETYLNERDQYLDSMLDYKAEGLKTGSLVKVKVQKETKDGYICETSFGMLAVITDLHTGEADLQVGEEVEGVVLHIAVDESNTCLELSTDRLLVRSVSRRVERPNMDKARVGQTLKAQVLLVKDDFVLVTLKQHASGTLAFIPRRQHPNDVLASATTNLAVGEETKVSIQKCDGDRVLAILASLAKEEEDHPRHNLQLGQIVSAQVQTILPGQMNIKIGSVNARVHVTEVVDEVRDGIFPFGRYKKGQDIKVKIIGFRHFKSFKYLPISHPRIHKAMPECTLKPSKLRCEGCPTEDQAFHTRTYQQGEKVAVFSVKFENNKLWVNVRPTQSGVISVFDLSRDLGILKHAERHFAAGHGYLATVVGVEEEGLIHLSLTGKKEVVKKNQVVTGKVMSVSDKGLALRLPGEFRGLVPTWDSEEARDKVWNNVHAGDFLRCLVLCCKDRDQCVLSLNLTHRSESNLKKVQKQMKAEASPTRKRKRSSESEAETERIQSPSRKIARTSSEVKESVSPPPVMQEPDLSLTEAKVAPMSPAPPKEEPEHSLRVSTGFLWDQTPQASDLKEEEEEEEEEMEPPKKRKKKSGSTVQPDSIDNPSSDDLDFEKRLLTSPNDSKLWIEFMCKELSEGKTDKARSIGNKALQTISFDEEQERLNIWMALLNLENVYGTKEDVSKTLQRAVLVNDPFTLYRRVAAMYSTSGKMEEAEQIHQTMVRKFKQNRQVWIDFGLFLYRQARLDAARKLLQRALLSLDRRDHVPTITQFASLECKHGEAERGATMFEKLITEFPKRSDVMSVYIDMVVRTGDLHRARELFERALTLKNTKFFFKKYIKFEEKYGTEETQARLRARIEEEL